MSQVITFLVLQRPQLSSLGTKTVLMTVREVRRHTSSYDLHVQLESHAGGLMNRSVWAYCQEFS
jgi:hypothetical protein